MFWITKKNIKIRDLEFEIARLKSESKNNIHELEILRRANIESHFKIKKLEEECETKKVQSNIDLSSPLFQRIIKAGRNVLIKKAHPDHGGTREEMEEIQKAFEVLKTVKLSYRSKYDEAFNAQREALYRGMAAQRNRGGSFW